MRRFSISLLLGLVLGVVAVVGDPGAAQACDYDPPFELPAAAFTEAADLGDLNAADGPVQNAFDAWVVDYEWLATEPGETLPAIVAVRRRSTVVHVRPPQDEYASPAGVVVYDAVWGPAFDAAPVVYDFDLSSCAGLFDLPELGQSEWVIVTEPNAWFSFTPAPADYDAIDAELTRLFGEPTRPEPDAAVVESELDALLVRGQRDFRNPIEDIRRLEGFENVAEPVVTVAQPDVDDAAGTETAAGSGQPGEDSDATTRNIVIAGVVVGVALLGLRSLLRRRQPTVP